MPQDPTKGETLSAMRRRGAASRWSAQPAQEVALPIMSPPQAKAPAKVPAKKTTKPAWSAEQEKRISEITDDAIAAYNAILAKPNGRLQKVTDTGIERRRKQVDRCIRVASRICEKQYGNKRIEPKFWEQYFNEVNKDDFRSGRKQGGPGHENWKPGFEYLTREQIMLDVFEAAVSRHG